jgi:hypothetical protein
MYDPSVRKAYVHRPVAKEEQEGDRKQYRFCEFAKDAWHWTTNESAERARGVFNMGIEIPSAKGGIYTIKDFNVEELVA